MGGFFGVASRRSAVLDVYLGTDYHSHLGTRRGGMAAYSPELGLQREIHNIENSPFRTKFARAIEELKGNSAIGCISDTDPQPLLIHSKLGKYAICTIGIINNAETLMRKVLENGGYFDAMTGGKVNSNELVAALVNRRVSFEEGIRYAQDLIEGTASILLLKEDGNLIAARDKMGRLPVLIGRNSEGYCVSFENFAYQKLGYQGERELGAGEIAEISSDGVKQLSPPRKEMRICAFLWTYYGYPTSVYEGVSVEMMRCRNGGILARKDRRDGTAQDIDYVGGVPDSGTPHAIGYANTRPLGRAASCPPVRRTETRSQR